ncbi:putative glycerol-3-phosphate 1-O-acyltransferase [Helianthus annuus]|nr:putative glycerol-3-phosphate 1-O-acyltransferase [Helianthus annuus]KAJ0649096.1 putative glycerol-3-phosphate 1-O-acyltransferase [Helianthus annuus]KAJ0845227.1 putative glycerol-3-phosphate 1-O-acyltransferase [Helianthus annuus]
MDRKMLQHLFFLYKFLFKLLCYPQGHNLKSKSLKYMRYESMADKHTPEELLNTTLVFEVEGGLLRSNSLFPYFMLVAFEGGGLLRGLVLFLFYPLVCLVGKERGLKIMVFICFFGIKKDNFRIGRTVLPKFFMEDLGFEGFEVVRRCGRKVGVSELPRVMVEGFLKDCLDVDCVFGKDLKVVCGYFVGMMEDETTRTSFLMKDVFGDMKSDCHLIGFGTSNKILDHQLFSLCKEIYLASKADKRRWRALPRDKYPKPLIFHDGRIAFMPTYLDTLAMIVWVPFGLGVGILRIIITMSFPYTIAIPILCFTGMSGRRYTRSFAKNKLRASSTNQNKSKGTLYVCNHRTLLDPIYISMAIMKPVTALTYSVSPLSELLSPIKTFHLSRNKEKDYKIMETLLNQNHDVVLCPEGTTCREPYVLRFSPLFAEISNDFIPVALDAKVSMFYGTTASGFKFLDPLFFVLNPTAIYHIKILENLLDANIVEQSRIEIANRVQKQIAEALGFQCTNLTRRDKYMVLAGNEGVV